MLTILITALMMCQAPAEPIVFPDGSRASHAEMQKAIAAVQIYVKAMDRFLACHERETHERLRDEGSQLWGTAPGLRHDHYVEVMRTRSAEFNAHVDRMHAIAERINREVRKYKSRDKVNVRI